MNRIIQTIVTFLSLSALGQHIETDRAQMNLKGNVKKIVQQADQPEYPPEIQHWYNYTPVLQGRLEDGTDDRFKMDRPEFEVWEFDQNGFLVSTSGGNSEAIRSSPLVIKQSFQNGLPIEANAKVNFPRPIPIKIRPNRIELFTDSQGEKSRTGYYRRYVIDHGRIVSEKSYSNFHGNSDKEYAGDEDLEQTEADTLLYTTRYHYDELDRMIRKEVDIPKREFEDDISLFNNGYSCDGHVVMTYDYQNHEIVAVSATHNGRFEFKQTFTTENGVINSIEIIVANPITEGTSKKMIRKYDASGNLIQIDHYDLGLGRKVVFSEFYEYDYDRHDNWTACRYYFNGKKIAPDIILKRTITYF